VPADLASFNGASYLAHLGSSCPGDYGIALAAAVVVVVVVVEVAEAVAAVAEVAAV